MRGREVGDTSHLQRLEYFVRPMHWIEVVVEWWEETPEAMQRVR
jgi:hypothetical protein